MSSAGSTFAVAVAPPKTARWCWLPGYLGAIPPLVLLAAKACGGVEAVAALSGANPSRPLESIGAIYLAAWFATATVTPSMTIASIILFVWEQAAWRKAVTRAIETSATTIDLLEKS